MPGRAPPWLRTGPNVWQDLAPFARDFFLPRGMLGGVAPSEPWASNVDAAAAGRALLAELAFPLSGGGVGRIPEEFAPFWTERGARATSSPRPAALEEEGTISSSS